MKKIIIAVFSILFSGMVYAATKNIVAASPVSVLTASQIAATIPTYVGQLVVCSNCGSQNDGFPTLCISSETATSANAFVFAVSTGASTGACK